MTARKAFHGAAGAAILAAATLVGASTAEARCVKHPHVGRATGFLRATAGLAARQDWRREVRAHEGREFALWRHARNRTTRCRKPEGGRWRCVARAYPCND